MSLSQSLSRSRDPEAPELDIFLHMESLISKGSLAAPPGKSPAPLLQPAVLTHHQNISGSDEFAHSVSCSSTLWTTKDQEEENLVQQCLIQAGYSPTASHTQNLQTHFSENHMEETQSSHTSYDLSDDEPSSPSTISNYYEDERDLMVIDEDRVLLTGAGEIKSAQNMQKQQQSKQRLAPKKKKAAAKKRTKTTTEDEQTNNTDNLKVGLTPEERRTLMRMPHEQLVAIAAGLAARAERAGALIL